MQGLGRQAHHKLLLVGAGPARDIAMGRELVMEVQSQCGVADMGRLVISRRQVFVVKVLFHVI